MRGLFLAALAAAGFAGGYGPAWSPDGSQLAYVGPAPASNQVLVASGNAAAAAPEGQTLVEVRWSSAARLVYQDSNYTLWTSTGGTARRLGSTGVTGGAGEAFSLSRDGREVAFTAPCGCRVAQGTAVHFVAAVGGVVHGVPRPAGTLDADPSFSSDGTRLVFSRDGTLAAYPLRGGAVRSLGLRGDWPAYSPDGRRLAFFTRAGLEVATGRTARVVLPFHWVDGTASFAWSPDSTHIAYATSTHVGIVDLAGTNRPVALPGLRPGVNAPQWSPDGNELAFTARAGDLDQRVYVVDADGSGLRRIA